MPVVYSRQQRLTRAPQSVAQAAAVVASNSPSNGHKAASAQSLAASPVVRKLSATPSLKKLSALVERLEFANQLNLTYGGLRDVDRQLGYEPSPGIKHYRYAYRRNGIAKRIVEVYPLATWSADMRITEDEDSNVNTPLEDAAGELFDRLSVSSRLTCADILANIGHYSVVLIGASGKLETPLPSSLKQILYLRATAEEHATIQSWDEDKDSARYGLPLTYNITLGAPPPSATGVMSSRQSSQQVVHWSRLLHVAEGLLEDDTFGTPRLEAVWNSLDDLRKVVGGGAEAAWKRMDPGMQFDIDPEMALDEGEIESMEEQIDDYVHGLRRVLQTRGTKANLLSTTVAGFGPNANSVLSFICATIGVPQRIFLGSERGQLASGQDADNWAERINERRRMFAAPLVRQFVDRLIDHGVLPKPKRTKSQLYIASSRQRVSPLSVVPRRLSHVPLFGRYKYVVAWPEVGALDNVATAEILNKLAAANQSNAQAGGGLILTSDEIRHQVLDLGPRPKEAKVPPTGRPDGDSAEPKVPVEEPADAQ